MYDDTLTDREFADALCESHLATVDRPDAEPDLHVEGLNHSLVSRLLALFLPKGGG